MPVLWLQEIEDLAYRALVASRTHPANARHVAASIAAAEADGIPSHGLLRLPTYCDHARTGKVDGFAIPTVEKAGPAVLRVDACNGFAHPAIDIALGQLALLAGDQGLAAAAIRNSYNSGVMGHHVARLAQEGLVGLGFANAPAVIAPWGGSKAVFGTNPVAFAAPREGAAPIVIDQASSVVARGEVLLRARRGESIPEGWALDARGRPTTDPNAALDGGTMAPAGGHKGTSLALMVELLAATLTGSLQSFEAGSLTANDGKPAGVGQLFIAIDPEWFAGPGFENRAARLCEELAAQAEARIPGARRWASRQRAAVEGVELDEALLDLIQEIAGRAE